jgi:hypothetical protein
MKKEWRWKFRGFQSALEGRPVQSWYDNLHEDAKDEIRDLLNYLQKLTSSLWRRPEFAGLHGAGGISELSPPDVALENKGRLETMTYRVYGYFGPTEGVYTFLHGVRKKVNNDTHGKRIAKERLRQIEYGAATTHEFEF